MKRCSQFWFRQTERDPQSLRLPRIQWYSHLLPISNRDKRRSSMLQLFPNIEGIPILTRWQQSSHAFGSDQFQLLELLSRSLRIVRSRKGMEMQSKVKVNYQSSETSLIPAPFAPLLLSGLRSSSPIPKLCVASFEIWATYDSSGSIQSTRPPESSAGFPN